MDSSKVSISIKGLQKSYGTHHVLKGIDLEVESGSIIGYIGPNGAGKSTTIKILCGITSDFEGQVTVNGLDLRSNPLEVKRQIGYIPEKAALYTTLTPMEYLEFVGQLYGLNRDTIADKSLRLLELFDMKGVAYNRMDTFSKGMQQKVLIISGLINNPKILFLDEPLSGLDANSVIIVKEMLLQLAREGKTIFYSSHLMDVVEKISNRIVLIDKGVVVADGTFESLNQGRGESLEKLFAELTGEKGLTDRAEKIVQAFE